MLKEESIKVETGKNGAEGLEMIRKHPSKYYDIILTDLRMPIMSGQEMIEQIRKYEEPYSQLPIIVITGEPTELEKEKCFNLGVNDYLNKPIRLDQLKQCLINVLSQKISNTDFLEEEKMVSNREEEKKEHNFEGKNLENWILLIDDDPFSSGIIQNFMSNEGIKTIRAFTIKIVIKNLKKN